MANGKPVLNTVERGIYFCRAYFDGKRDSAASDRVAEVLPEIEKLEFKFGQRYGENPDADRWPCMWVDQNSPPIRMEIAWLTERDIPQIEEGGRRAALPLRRGQHIHYPAHMVMFEAGVLGYEYWKPAPGPWVLARYLNGHGLKGKLSFDFLYKKDTLTQLRRLGEFRTLTLRIPVSRSAALTARDETLGKAVAYLQHIGDDVIVELKIGPEETRGPLEGLKQIVRRLARSPKRDGMQKLEAVGYDEETKERVTIDLLNPRLMQKREMVLLSSTRKAVEPESAYAAIERSFASQREEILDAAGQDSE